MRAPALSVARPAAPLRRRRLGALAGLAVLLGAVVVAALAVGARPVPPGVVLDALLSPDPALPDHLVVRELRLPRLAVGLLVGAALGVAGVLMQGITRNPLADPGLLGINAGASLALVGAVRWAGVTDPGRLVWFAFAGAGLVAGLVQALGSLGRGAATPVRLALAGAALTSLLASLVSAILLIDPEVLQVYRFWVVGSLAGAERSALLPLLPAFTLGLGLAVWAGAALNALALGDDAARSLGVRIGLARAGVLLAVTLLSGASVALAGPVAFVGLVVPHLARAALGPDQRLGVLAAALLGPVVLLLADVAGRVVLPPGEVPVGIMTGLVGGPAFVWIVRRLRILQP
ncbi:FecCD family ABC transporter permease [Rubellimicrobium aerolatum]|uniref:FecCD family ABC transporter permease n=1 Tax=Rubellimicrobium aerolatum TaxID=490979 RepID=A0ABW0SHM7_9RHOB|nr:iron ABC transporter permease [Rubellimicrobium aerolatum]MBP1807533.1 iron complex transport system permease protein [Rubellimicrobium aerolatum]